MKKILLSLLLIGSFVFGTAQTVLNEIYTDPGAGNSEFFELYNSGVGSQTVNCYTLVTYYESGNTKGFYVLDLPNLNVGPKGFFVGAAASPFNTQSTTGTVADFNWNAPSFRNGSTGGSLKKFQLKNDGTGYTDETASIPVNFNNLFSGGNGLDYYVMIFIDGVLSNGFIGGSNSGLLPTSITDLPDLSVDMAGSCADFTIDFSALGAMENVISQPGSDNGYARTSDGKCGSWEKTSTSVKHTPGVTNGGAAGLEGSLTTIQFIEPDCGYGTGQAVVSFDITGVTGSATEADDFPVRIYVYNDVNRDGNLDGADLLIKYKDQATIAAGPDTVKYSPRGIDLILVYRTKRGCFDKVISLRTDCISLPVHFTSFIANRQNPSTVGVSWTTASEENSKGFNIQRNVGGVWTTIAYVPSQAVNGTSTSDLTYNYTDANSLKGITQYRIQQVDLDGKAKYSDIRAIRGDGAASKVVVYPNPSVDGKVNVVFEDNTSVRDVYVNDMQGRVVKSYKGITNNILVIERLTSGFYTIKITNRNTAASSVEKVVVK